MMWTRGNEYWSIWMCKVWMTIFLLFKWWILIARFFVCFVLFRVTLINKTLLLLTKLWMGQRNCQSTKNIMTTYCCNWMTMNEMIKKLSIHQLVVIFHMNMFMCVCVCVFILYYGSSEMNKNLNRTING